MKILYFAWLREKIGKGQEDVDLPGHVTTVSDLLDWLADQSDAHQQAFADRASVRVAVDQRHAKLDDAVSGAAEVAFFPPVTGG